MFNKPNVVLSVSGQPSLGPALLDVQQPRRPELLGTGREPFKLQPPPVLAPIVDTTLLPHMSTQLDTLISEIRILRAELASRTIAARSRRFWNWLRGVFS